MAGPLLSLSPVDEYCFDVAGFVVVRGALSVRPCLGGAPSFWLSRCVD